MRDFSNESQGSETLKKMIIMCICKNSAYFLGAMDQDADYIWDMTLNCLGHNNAHCQYALVRIGIVENMHYCVPDTS